MTFFSLTILGSQLSGPIMADVYGASDRGKALAVAALAPYLGPALGPILGGLISQHVHWYWLFWAMSLLDTGVVLVGFLTLRESYKPVLLRRWQRQQAHGKSAFQRRFLWSEVKRNAIMLRSGLARPLTMLWQRPILQVLTFLYGLNFGIYAIVLCTFATLWIERYGQSEGVASLHYIAIAVGSTITSQGGGRLMDIIWRRLNARRLEAAGEKDDDKVVVPEFRVPMLALGSLLAPIGLIWYGWAAQQHAHWLLADAGVTLFSVGGFAVSQSLLAYLLDEFGEHSASAGAAERILAYVMGFVFPIFAPQLYERLGYGWGNTLLALLFVVLDWPAVPILWKLGPQIRAIDRGRKT